MKNILILCGGPSSEYEVSIFTTKEILKNIDKSKFNPTIGLMNKGKQISFMSPSIFLSNKYLKYFSFNKSLTKIKEYDFVLISMHGEFGEDGKLQKIFERNGIKYHGSDSVSSKLCMDKYKSTKLVNKKLKILTPKTLKIKLDDIQKYNHTYPLFFKPNRLGSSVGAEIINNEKDLKKYLKEVKSKTFSNDYFLLQEYIKGIEVSCGVLENKKGKFTLLPPVEILPKSTFFDYKSKYSDGGSRENCPPKRIPENNCKIISKYSKEIHKLLKCKTYSRSDYIYSNNKIYYLETNTLPGLTKNSLLPKEVKEIGMKYSELITYLIENS
jgi:D-alanine-D-alanine ligase